MKYAEFNIEKNKIEFLNSVFGIESVLLNGIVVSKKFTFSGFNHELDLNSESFILKSKYKQFDKREIELELIKKGVTIEKQIAPVDIKQRLFWMSIGIGLVVGGYWLGKFIIGI